MISVGMNQFYIWPNCQFMIDFQLVHPRSTQILEEATLNRDPNALTALTPIRSINPRFEKKYI